MSPITNSATTHKRENGENTVSEPAQPFERKEGKENKMGTEPVFGLILKMSLPIMISMLVLAFYNVVDSIFVAQISENALTAVGLAFPAQNLMISVGVGTGVGINALLSKSLGEKNQDTANRTATNGIFLALCSWAVFALLGLFFSRDFIAAQTGVEEIIQYGTTYVQIVSVFSMGLVFQICFERLLQATGRTMYTMYSQGLGAIVNIILDPLLIFGIGPFPKLGVAGAAVATVVGQILGALLGLYFNLKLNHEIQIKAKGYRPDGLIIKKIYAVGVPSIILTSVASVMTFGINIILNGINTTAVTVFAAYYKLQSFIFMPVYGLNNGVVPVLAFNYGARNPGRMKESLKAGVFYAVVIMAVGVLVFQLFPTQLLMLFNPSDYMLEIGVPALRTISLCFVPAAFCMMISSACQAVGHGVISLVLSVVRQLVVILPAAWILGQMFGLDGLWYAFPLAEVVSVVISLFMLRFLLKKVIAPLGALPN